MTSWSERRKKNFIVASPSNEITLCDVNDIVRLESIRREFRRRKTRMTGRWINKCRLGFREFYSGQNGRKNVINISDENADGIEAHRSNRWPGVFAILHACRSRNSLRCGKKLELFMVIGLRLPQQVPFTNNTLWCLGSPEANLHYNLSLSVWKDF